jgi:hypothetical protein
LPARENRPLRRSSAAAAEKPNVPLVPGTRLDLPARNGGACLFGAIRGAEQEKRAGAARRGDLKAAARREIHAADFSNCGDDVGAMESFLQGEQQICPVATARKDQPAGVNANAPETGWKKVIAFARPQHGFSRFQRHQTAKNSQQKKQRSAISRIRLKNLMKHSLRQAKPRQHAIDLGYAGRRRSSASRGRQAFKPLNVSTQALKRCVHVLYLF